MAQLQFCDKHNMLLYLENTEDNTEFHQIIDFLNCIYIKFALTESTTVYASLIKQFWKTAKLEVDNEGHATIVAILDKKVRVVVTEASIRRRLKLNDEEGISYLLDDEIFAQ